MRSSRSARTSTYSSSTGVDLPNPDGRIEGSGKRARHVMVRTVDEVAAPCLTAAIAAQIAFRAPGTA